MAYIVMDYVVIAYIVMAYVANGRRPPKQFWGNYVRGPFSAAK